VAAVRCTGPEKFELLFRRRVQTCPDDLPRQPFHAVAEEGMPKSTIERVRAAAARLAGDAVAEAIRDAGAVSAAGVAMGRTVLPTDLDRILSSHALLHSAEGELYRDALSEAAGDAGLRVVRFLNKEVRSEAAGALGWPLERLEAWLVEAGKVAGKPWTRDEKDASAAAMLALAVTLPR